LNDNIGYNGSHANVPFLFLRQYSLVLQCGTFYQLSLTQDSEHTVVASSSFIIEVGVEHKPSPSGSDLEV
jgi:hypothetical protein